MNAFQRILGVFFSPGKTFADIARSPGFVAPLIVVTLVSLAVSIVGVNRIGMERIILQALEKSSRAEQMTAEQKQQAVQWGAKVGAFFTYAGPIVGVPLVALGISGLLMLVVNFVFGGVSEFKQMFAVVAHSLLPGVIAGILGLVIIFLKDPSDLDIQNLIASNLGPLVSGETSKFLHRLLQSFDLFAFWQMGLLATGISAVARFKFGKSLLAVCIPWALYVLAASGIAVLR